MHIELNTLHTLKIIYPEELTKAQELLNPIMDKYDYSKLPKKN